MNIWNILKSSMIGWLNCIRLLYLLYNNKFKTFEVRNMYITNYQRNMIAHGRKTVNPTLSYFCQIMNKSNMKGVKLIRNSKWFSNDLFAGRGKRDKMGDPRRWRGRKLYHSQVRYCILYFYYSNNHHVLYTLETKLLRTC